MRGTHTPRTLMARRPANRINHRSTSCCVCSRHIPTLHLTEREDMVDPQIGQEPRLLCLPDGQDRAVFVE